MALGTIGGIVGIIGKALDVVKWITDFLSRREIKASAKKEQRLDQLLQENKVVLSARNKADAYDRLSDDTRGRLRDSYYRD